MGIEIRFQFLQQVVPIDDSIPISVILITFPPGFVNAVNSTSDVLNLKNLPVYSTSGVWVDFTKIDSLSISLAQNTIIPKSEFWIRFPVYTPPQMDPDNIWYISFCGHTGGCTSPTDSGVIVTLPIGGFDIGDVNQQTILLTPSFTVLSAPSSKFVIIPIMTALLTALMLL